MCPSTPAPGGTRERFEQLFAEMESESDRGCILIGASAIDDVLRTRLHARLSRDEHIAKHAVKPMFAAMGPLSTFSARIKLVYAMGLIPRWMFEDLEKIRRVRNKAAHEFNAKTFESPEVVHIALSLQGAQHATRPSTDGLVRSDNPRKIVRLWFTLTVSYIAGFLDALDEEPSAEKVLERLFRLIGV